MKIIYEYSTHDNASVNNWIRLRDESESEKPEDSISPMNGEPALLAKPFYPADLCILTIFPARASDRAGGDAAYFKNKYFLLVSDITETKRLCSSRLYDWDEAIQVAGWFQNLSFAAAVRVWKSKRL